MALSRVTERLRERVPPRWKFALKRLAFWPVRLGVRASARFRNLAARVRASAEAHGLDLGRARGAHAHAPFDQPWGASDLLILSRALSERLDPARAVRTSIIVPVFNRAELTFQCLRSLVREADLTETEIVVVNNASTDETREVLECFGGLVRVIDNDENQGFVAACNRGAATARGQYLLFLNNDTVVLPGWLENLVETAEGDARVGAVGSLFLYPDGAIQEAGGIVWQSGETARYGWGERGDDRRFQFAREVDYCSGASLLVRKSLFERLGGFDPRYAPAFYEDADLCFGVRALGYKVVYQPLSRLVHYGGATAGMALDAGFKKYQVVNREKFREKWRDRLEREHFADDLSNAERASNRKSAVQVVVLDDHLPTPDRDAGSARMAFILKALSEWSHTVFVSTSKQTLPEYERQLWKAGVETVGALDLQRLLKRRRFSAAVISRPLVAEVFLKLVRRADPTVRIVFDTVDVHFVRLGREYELTGDARVRAEAARFRRVEPQMARLSDLVWCCSPEDGAAIAQAAPGVAVAVVPTIHPLHGRGRPLAEREHLLFVGNFRHRPNADGVLFFVREIFPLVRAQLPGAQLLLVGDNAPPEVAAHASDSVRVLGYVPDIEPLMASARVFVAPIRFGAGVKGKIGEALSYGLPVVTTTTGAEGMSLRDGEEALIADDPRDFADAVLRLYRDSELWHKLSDAGHAHVARRFTPEVVGKAVNDSIKSLLARAERND